LNVGLSRLIEERETSKELKQKYMTFLSSYKNEELPSLLCFGGRFMTETEREALPPGLREGVERGVGNSNKNHLLCLVPLETQKQYLSFMKP
jgi:hypothetical protein